MTMREQRPPRLILATSAIALAAAATAAFSLNYGAASIEGAAQNRLSEARRALADAEALAAAAETRREAAAGPLRQAQIVGATLDRAPSVVGRLAALAEATPDNAYIKRLNMGPELISGEFIAPDAAALAVKIGDVPVFSSARLKGAARAESETLQRATLEISPRVSE